MKPEQDHGPQVPDCRAIGVGSSATSLGRGSSRAPRRLPWPSTLKAANVCHLLGQTDRDAWDQPCALASERWIWSGR